MNEDTTVNEETTTSSEDPTVETTIEDPNLETEADFSQVDYTEQLEDIKEWLEINQNQNEEIKGLLQNIDNNLVPSNISEGSEVGTVDYSEVLNNIWSSTSELYVWVSAGISIAISLLIIYFIYKMIVPFTR